MALNRYALTFVSTCISQHSAYLIVKDRVLQIFFGNEPCTERVTAHNNCTGYITVLGGDMCRRGIFLTHILSSNGGDTMHPSM